MSKSLSFAAVVAVSLIAAPAVAGDWTGGYVGAELGFGTFDSNISGDDTGFIGGLTGGYDYDFGDYVVGVGIDYDFVDATLDVPAFVPASLEVNGLLRLKARGGYDLGQGLIYATAGYAHVYGDASAGVNSASYDEGGYFVGGGYEHLIGESFSVGGEILYNRFNDVESSGIDIEATTYQIRAAYRF